MPFYDNTPFKRPVKTLVAGWPSYLFGSYNADVAEGVFAVTNFALTSNVVTLTGVMREGNIPAAGDFISTQGQPVDASHVAISTVTIAKDTGIGTITYALTHADVVSVPKGGVARILPAETFEAITASGSSIPVTVQFNDPETNIGRTLTLVVNTPANTLTGTVVAQLQGALRDEDSEYVGLGSTISITTSAQVKTQAYTLEGYRFYRLNVSGITGGAGTICAKIM